MRIAYVTCDPVNRDLAERLAEECRVELCPLGPGEVPAAASPDAVLYDLDFLPADDRRAALDGLAAGRPPCPAAVHSYNLADGAARELRRRGVGVARRLDRRVIAALHRAVRQRRAAALSPPPRTERVA